MDFEQYCKDKIDIGVFNLKLSQDEFVKNCKRCFGIGGMASVEYDISYNCGEYDFSYKEKIWRDDPCACEMVTKFAGSWKQLYHFLREKYGKEDKQLTLW